MRQTIEKSICLIKLCKRKIQDHLKAQSRTEVKKHVTRDTQRWWRRKGRRKGRRQSESQAETLVIFSTPHTPSTLGGVVAFFVPKIPLYETPEDSNQIEVCISSDA